MDALKHLLNHNHALANIMRLQPAANERLPPKYLWIDCVDNDVLPNHILGLSRSEILVYRNLAHQINHIDLNCLSVLEYAVQVLAVKHIIVCGHYDCGMLLPSAQYDPAELAKNWLYPVQMTALKYQAQLSAYQPDVLRLEKLCDLNVIEQVVQLANTTVVQRTWKNQQELCLHGWVYSPTTSLLKDLAVDMGSEMEVMRVYESAVAACLGNA